MSSFKIIRLGGVCYRPLADPEANTALLLARRTDDISPLVAGFVAVAQEAAD